MKPGSARPLQALIGYTLTWLVLSAVVLHVSVPVTFPAWPAGLYVIAGSLGESPLRFGVVRYALELLTVTVKSGVVMMLPLLAVPMRQRDELQAAAKIAVIPVGPAFGAVTGPLIGLPCCAHVTPPSCVATTVPMAPPAKQSRSSTHAMPVSACTLLLACGVHVAPPSVEPSMTAVPETTAPVA